MKTKTDCFTAGLLLATLVNGFGQTTNIVQFESPNYTIAEKGETAIINVLRSGNTNGIASVDYATSGGTATAGADYTAQSGTLTFAAGETNKTFAVSILDDGLMEGDETVNLTLARPTGGAVLGVPITAVLTIQDNELPGVVDFGFDPGTGVSGGAFGIVFSVAIQTDEMVLIGGDFTAVNGISRNRIARLNADGSLDVSFDPGTGINGTNYVNVNSVVVQPDGKIFIGGWFSAVNSLSRDHIARLNADGSPDTSFQTGLLGKYLYGGDPQGGEPFISSLAVQTNGKVLMAGGFSFVNGVIRSGIARLNADGSLDGSFNPGTGVDGLVASVAVQPDGKVLIGGVFTTFDGLSRKGIARLNSDGSLDASFNPGTRPLNGGPAAHNILLQIDGKVVVVGGGSDFFRLNADGSLDNRFNPDIQGGVLALHEQPDSKLLMAGQFTTVNGISRNGIARLNRDGSLDAGFNPGTGASGNSFSFPFSVVEQVDGKVIIGGGFRFVNGVSRNGIARLFGENSGLVSIEFKANDYKVDENTGEASIVVVRNGNSIGSLSVDYVTRDGTATSGLDYMPQIGTLSFGPREIEKTIAIPILNDGLIEGDETINLTLSNPTGGVVFGAGASKAVLTIVDNDQGIVFDASAYTVNENGGAVMVNVLRGDDGTNTVRVDYSTGDGTARAGADYVAQAGTLTFASGETGKTIAIPVLDDGQVEGDETVNLTLSNPTGGVLGVQANAVLIIQDNEIPVILDASFDPKLTFEDGSPGGVYCILAQRDGKALIGGIFDQVNGVGRARIARLNADGSLDNSFVSDTQAANIVSGVYAIARQADGRVVIGGALGVARLNADGSLDGSFSPFTQVNEPLSSVAIQGEGRVLIGGNFTIPHKGIVRLNTNGSLDVSFVPGIENVSFDFFRFSALAVQPDGKILVGGLFDRADDSPDFGIVRLNPDGTLDTGFRPTSGGAVGEVASIVVLSDGKILVGGSFSREDDSIRYGVARLNADGSPDSSFIAGIGVSGQVRSLAIQADGMIFIAGWTCSGEGGCHYSVQHLNPNGSVDSSYGALRGAGAVRALAVTSDGNLMVGGSFGAIGGVPRNGIALLYADFAILSSFGFSSANYAVSETAGITTITAERIGDVSGTTTVDYTTADGSANAGLNYVATNGTLTFAPLEITKTIIIPILHDDLVSGPLTFGVVLRNPSGGTVLGLSTSAAIILNRDPGFLQGGVVRQANGQLTLTLTAVGRTYVLQASTNLVDWVSLSTNAAQGPMTFTDTDAPRFGQRFYQLKAGP